MAKKLDEDYEKWSAGLKANFTIFKEDGRWYAVDAEGIRYGVVYDRDGLVRLANATRNIHHEY